MKKLLLLPLLFAATAWTTTGSTGSVFTLKITSSRGMQGTVKIFYDTPGTRSEVDASMNSGFSIRKVSVIKKAEPNMVYQLDEKTKTYSTVEVSNAADNPSEPATATLLGSDSLNGFMCKHIRVKQGNRNWEIWNTTAVAEYASLSGVMNRQRYIGNHGLHDALKTIHAEGFPVKIILTDKEGTTTTELVETKKQKLDPSLFEVPPGYTKAAYNPYPQNMPAGGKH
jgi:hypothetical protein